MLDHSDYLLYVLSSRKETSWASFKQIFGDLYSKCYLAHGEEPTKAEAMRWPRWRAVRALDSLGHCDASFDRGAGFLYAGPSVLARLPVTGLPTTILCGGRGPETVATATELCQLLDCTISVSSQATNIPFVPRRIEIQGGSLDALTKLAEGLRARFESVPPSWSILDFSVSLQDYLKTCQWKQASEINWDRKDFNPQTLRFEEPTTSEEKLRLSQYKDPIRNTNKHFLWDGQLRAEIDLDWGRFAVLHSAHRQVLHYDSGRTRLASPANILLPRLLARSLVLCTGYVPGLVDAGEDREALEPGIRYSVFRSVSRDMALVLAGKLGQELMETPVPIE